MLSVVLQTTAGDKIIAKPTSLTREMEDLSEESGLACCICREGYKYHPQKVGPFRLTVNIEVDLSGI